MATGAAAVSQKAEDGDSFWDWPGPAALRSLDSVEPFMSTAPLPLRGGL